MSVFDHVVTDKRYVVQPRRTTNGSTYAYEYDELRETAWLIAEYHDHTDTGAPCGHRYAIGSRTRNVYDYEHSWYARRPILARSLRLEELLSSGRTRKLRKKPLQVSRYRTRSCSIPRLESISSARTGLRSAWRRFLLARGIRSGVLPAHEAIAHPLLAGCTAQVRAPRHGGSPTEVCLVDLCLVEAAPPREREQLQRLSTHPGPPTTSGSGTPLCQGAASARAFRVAGGRRSVGFAGPGSG